MNIWECVCGRRYEGVEGWGQCYGSHPRRDGFAVVQRAAGEGSQGSAHIWTHSDGRRFNYPEGFGDAWNPKHVSSAVMA